MVRRRNPVARAAPIRKGEPGPIRPPRSLARSSAISHVPGRRPSLGENGFERLAGALDATFARGREGTIEEIGPGLYGPSLFYRAVGTFNLLRVCNHWIADLLG